MLEALRRRTGRGGAAVLFDLRKLRYVPTPEEARDIAERYGRTGAEYGYRMAYLADPGVQFGVARMVETLSGFRGVAAAVFTDEAEALAWLQHGAVSPLARRSQDPVLGLHHVTATVGDAQADVDFCLRVLGLRLVKRTVNFDNPGVYHFYYGDERGTPGTIWTTFPYKGRGVPMGEKGTGQITVTSFAVPGDSLGFWRARLREAGADPREGERRFGDETLVFSDPSGLDFELVASDRDARTPWTGGGIGAEAAVRGLHGVTLTVESPAPTIELLTGLLGFAVENEAEGRTRLAVNGGGPGRTLEISYGTGAGPARNGLGTVHHVALAVADPGDQIRLRHELLRQGRQPTPVLDRQYFQSVYFREPGGILLEIATMQPGFTLDELPADLGSGLKLPPWEEPNRPAIEAALPRIGRPGA